MENTYKQAYIYQIYDSENPSIFFIDSSDKEPDERMLEIIRFSKFQKCKFYDYFKTHRMYIKILKEFEHEITKASLRLICGQYIQELKPLLNVKKIGSIDEAGGIKEYQKKYRAMQKAKAKATQNEICV